MDDEERLERIGRRARLDEPPAVHVRASVLAALGEQEVWNPADLRGLKWVAAASVAVLVPFTVAAVVAWPSWSHPLLGVLYGGL